MSGYIRTLLNLIRYKEQSVRVTVSKGFRRHDIVSHLSGNTNIGLELGVAEGIYSKRMVNSNVFKVFYGIDAYADMHDTFEYKRALKHIGLEANYKLLRMKFDEALDLFDDSYFDFIFVDGYAHTGQEGGKTLYDWYPKLKVGGIMAGDDYHDDWPLVKHSVNEFAAQLGVELMTTDVVESNPYSQFPCWYFFKQTESKSLEIKQNLAVLGKLERIRVSIKRQLIK